MVVVRHFQSIQGSQRAICNDDYRDLDNGIGCEFVKGEGDSRRKYLERFIVMEHLNLASDKLLDKWRHHIFQEVQKPSILASAHTLP